MERATIFLMSISAQAQKPAISIVALPIGSIHSNLNLLNRINRYTPAVTRVEEWTRALTGVGAAIADGSQEEKGIWALLVIEVSRISITRNWAHAISWLWNRDIPRIIRRKQSPNRLVKAVIIPEPSDLRFL